MFHYLLQVIGVDRKENIEKVFSWWSLSCWICVWKVLDELLILFELRIQMLHWQLIVVWNRYSIYLCFFKELLLTTEYILEKVFIDMAFIREVVLQVSTMGLVLIIERTYLSMYCKKSILLFNFQESSWAWIYPSDLFLLSSVGLWSIVFNSRYLW